MRRAILAFAIPLLSASASFAQLDSPLKLVRGLRDAGMADLALERLEELKAKPGALSPEELKVLPLDVAGIRLEQALQEVEDGKRLALTAQAQGEFEAFIKANPAHPKTAEANIRIAQLIAVNAKGLLSKGRRIENKEARAIEFSKVRPEFDKAIARYQGAITALEARIKPMDAKDPLAVELTTTLLQAMLDAAILIYEKSKTFIGEGEGPKQSEEIQKAQKAFGKLADRYSNEKSGYLAAVWQLQCDFEITDPAKATKSMEGFVVANRANREAGDAVRQAQFFLIEHLDRSDNKDPITQKLRVEYAATEWLKRYPEARNSREGLRARFLYLGLAKQDRAKPGVKTDPKTGQASSITPEARVLLEAANRVYAELAETDNEFSDRAALYRLRNIVALLDAAGAGKDTPITAIRTLEQGYLAAQVQQARILQLRDKPETGGTGINLDDPKMPKDPPKGKDPAPKKEAPKAKEDPKAKELAEMVEEEDDPKKPKPKTEAQRRVDLAIAYLERGLSMVTAKDGPRDVVNAQLLLALFFKEANRAVEAAVLCEGVARNNPKMTKGALAAQIGVDSYNTAYEKLKGSVNKSDEALAADVTRIKALAEFADKTWPNEPPTDGVRQSLAFHLNKEKNYEGAWAALSRVSAGYPNVSQVRWAQGVALYYMVNPERGPKYRDDLQKNITTHAGQWTQTIGQLEALPEPAAATDPQRAAAYLLARTTLAQLYYMGGDYAKCEATAKAAAASAVKLTALDPGQRADLIADARAQFFRSVAARGAEFVRAKEFGKVAEVLDPEVTNITKELKEPAGSASTAAEKMRAAQRSLVILAMTASVQDKKVDRASELLGVLQSGGGSIEANILVMQQLVSSIRGQIDGLKKENKEAEAKELSDSFTQFLDKIATDPTKLPNSLVTFLGHGYDSVGESVKAFNLYGQVITKPFVNPGKTDEEKAEAEKANGVFVRRLQFEQVRALRQAGGESNLKTAMGLMRDMIGDPIAAKAPPKGWGYNNVIMRKEYIFLLEDQKQFNAAIKNWEKLSKEFVPTVPGPPKEGDKDGATKAAKRQTFFDLNYEVQRASAKAYANMALSPPAGWTKEKIDGKLTDIGQKLFNLTDTNKDINAELRDKIAALVAEYPQVKKKYDELAALGAAKKQ